MILRKEGKKKKFQQISQFVHIIHQNSDMESLLENLEENRKHFFYSNREQ
jgi:hypothetical protein